MPVGARHFEGLVKILMSLKINGKQNYSKSTLTLSCIITFFIV